MPAKTIKRATTAKVRTLTKKAGAAAGAIKSGTAAKAGATKARNFYDLANKASRK